jgi:hypothetical protein
LKNILLTNSLQSEFVSIWPDWLIQILSIIQTRLEIIVHLPIPLWHLLLQTGPIIRTLFFKTALISSKVKSDL